MRQYQTSDDRYADDIGEYSLLSREEEVSLSKKIRRGCKKSRDKMICANLRLVSYIAHAFGYSGMDIKDMISEGNIGLMKAVDRFEWERGCRFNTYACYWIRQSIQRCIDNQRSAIRIPTANMDKMRRFKKVRESLRVELQRDPTDEELREDLGLSESKFKKISNFDPKFFSINATPPGALSDELTFENIIEDDTINISLDFEKKEIYKIILEEVCEFPKREKEIIYRRYGIGQYDPETLEELGIRFRITRERVRQIEFIVLRKIRNRLQRIKITSS